MKTILNSIFKPVNLKQPIPIPVEMPLARCLEPRILLDAAAMETSADLAEKAVLESLANNYITQHDISDTIEDALDSNALGLDLQPLPKMK